MKYSKMDGYSNMDWFRTEDLEQMKMNIESELKKREAQNQYPYKTSVNYLDSIFLSKNLTNYKGYDDIQSLLTNISVLSKEEMHELIKYIREKYDTKDRLVDELKTNTTSMESTDTPLSSSYKTLLSPFTSTVLAVHGLL